MIDNCNIKAEGVDDWSVVGKYVGKWLVYLGFDCSIYPEKMTNPHKSVELWMRTEPVVSHKLVLSTQP
jgi:hypothetical protein